VCHGKAEDDEGVVVVQVCVEADWGCSGQAHRGAAEQDQEADQGESRNSSRSARHVLPTPLAHQWPNKSLNPHGISLQMTEKFLFKMKLAVQKKISMLSRDAFAATPVR
jgi:hypothetical protein